jgi:hypothetical protein
MIQGGQPKCSFSATARKASISTNVLSGRSGDGDSAALSAGVPGGRGKVQQQCAGRLRVFQHRGVSHARQQLDAGAGHDAVGSSRRRAPPVVVGAEDHQHRQAQRGQPAPGPAIGRQDRVVTVAVSHPFARQETVSAEDLAGQPVARPPADFLPALWEALVPADTPSGKPIPQAHEARGLHEVWALVRAG